MSNGGIMSYYLACNLPNRITAIASVTGSMLNAWYSCTPSPTRPFPVMEIHGTADGTVPYNGNTTFRHIDSVIKKWRVFNNCIPSPVTFSVTDIVTSDNSTAVNYRYTGGTGGSSVELFKVTNGSHSWPGALPVISNTNQDFNASVEIWRFFRQYKLNHFIINAGLSSNTSQNDNLVIYPDPANEVVNIRFTDEVLPSSVEVVDLSGKTIRKLSFSNSIQVADLNPGIYFLKIKRPDSEVNRKFVKN
jgi:polyhydroxybutyrate depolymerase